ncbi:MAG TPA: molybdenum cofactor biosynthesis protein MoaE [Acidimicrobiia bacterium]
MDDREQSIHVRVSAAAIQPELLIEMIGRSGSGATVLFLGTVRDHSPGRTGVTHLEYEVYPEQVEPKIADVISEASERWPILSMAVQHRSGRVELGEISVAVAVATAHRADAFDAAEFVIDELKRKAPIWKKEFWPGGSEWSPGS